MSGALHVGSAAQDQPLKAIVTLIDQTHGDGALPPIPLRRAALSSEGVYATGGIASLYIEVGTTTAQPMLSAAHEIGHFLDFEAIDGGGAFASEGSPQMTAWRQAVNASRAVQNLRTLQGQSHVILSNGASVRVKQRYLSYVLWEREIWARSYAQYIATKSRDVQMMAQLDARRTSILNQEVYTTHWADGDFAPILQMIDQLFVQLGWIK